MEFVKFIVNLYTCITVFLSSELLSNVFFLFFHKCLYLSRCDDKQTFIVFYFLFKKNPNLSVILLSIGEHADGENWKL